MPSIKDFKESKENKENKEKTSNTPNASKTMSETEESSSASSNKRAKRRPGREDTEENGVELSQDKVKVVDVETGEHVGMNSSETTNTNTHEAEQDSTQNLNQDLNQTSEKVHIRFPGSDLIRSTFPKSFDVAEKVATDWVHDGRFEDLSLGFPLADFFVGKGLRQAKDIEKKIMNSPVTEKVLIKVFEAGMKTHNTVNEIKSKVQDIRQKTRKK